MPWFLCSHSRQRPAFKKSRVAKTRTNFLLPARVDALAANAAARLCPLLTFLAGTGCRMSEALELCWDAVDLRGARAVVWQKQGNERRVDLPPRVLAALAALPARDGHVFRPVLLRRPRGADRGKTLGRATGWTAMGAGRSRPAGPPPAVTPGCRAPGEWNTAAGKPMRQWVSAITPHDLRHTWASWHYCVHKDLLKLRGHGGWATFAMVVRYAHMMPQAYRDDVLARLTGALAEVRKEA